MIEAPITKHTLNDHVELVGWHEDHWKYLANTGVSFLALTFDFEGFPTVLCKALVNGIPVVSTGCPVGPSEIVQDKKSGLLVFFGLVNKKQYMTWLRLFVGWLRKECSLRKKH